MYSTCRFCHRALGANDVLRTFPVGRALAFDPAKGRLWVICPRCGRWNLTPLEERWEAVAACERLFRAAELRASTDHVGLARASDGTRLVRIGAAPPTEIAIWRYEREFRRRNRAYRMLGAHGLALLGTMVAGGLLGLYVLPDTLGPEAFRIGELVIGGVWLTVTLRQDRAQVWRSGKMPVALVPGTQRPHLLRAGRVMSTELVSRPAAAGGWVVRVEYDAIGYDLTERDRTSLRRSRVPRSSFRRKNRRSVELEGVAGARALRALVPSLNAHGGTEHEVAQAVARLTRAHDGPTLMATLAADLERQGKRARGLEQLPRADLLALEMALTADTEQRALEGELPALADAWREAEEIAAIADDLALPASVRRRWNALRDR